MPVRPVAKCFKRRRYSSDDTSMEAPRIGPNRCTSLGFTVRMMHALVCSRKSADRSRRHLSDLHIILVTLFSGADGMLECFEDMVAAGELLEIPIRAEYRYACDSSKKVQEFGRLRRLRPEFFFESVEAVLHPSGIATDVFTNALVRVPTDGNTAVLGPERKQISCQNNQSSSNMNCVEKADGKTGMSVILWTQWQNKFRAAIALLENTPRFNGKRGAKVYPAVHSACRRSCSVMGASLTCTTIRIILADLGRIRNGIDTWR